MSGIDSGGHHAITAGVLLRLAAFRTQIRDFVFLQRSTFVSIEMGWSVHCAPGLTANRDC
jgi:hypothetical protein